MIFGVLKFLGKTKIYLQVYEDKEDKPLYSARKGYEIKINEKGITWYKEGMGSAVE